MSKKFKNRRYLKKQYKDFADEFAAIRQENQMTIEDVAAYMHIDPRIIERTEQGKMDISQSLFFSLCKIYGKKIHITLVDK